jgi:hypothetical protein
MEDPAAEKTEPHQRKDMTPHPKKAQQGTKETRLQTLHKRKMPKQRPVLLRWSKTKHKEVKQNIRLTQRRLHQRMTKGKLRQQQKLSQSQQ